MSGTVWTVLASGSLVLISGLGTTIVQSLLRRNQEFSSTVIELRMNAYSELLSTGNKFLPLFRKWHNGDPLPDDSGLCTQIVQLPKEITRESIQNALCEFRTAISKSALVSSDYLSDILDGLRSIVDDLDNALEKHSEKSEIEVLANTDLAIHMHWHEAQTLMRLELAVGVPLNWDKAEKKIDGPGYGRRHVQESEVASAK